jgi:hypothetical protein
VSVYQGTWAGNEPIVTAFDEAPRDSWRSIDPDSIRQLKPTFGGFGWGYSGAGAQSLAAALLFDATGDGTIGIQLYERFAVEVVRDLPHVWQLDTEDILDWLSRHIDLALEVQ